MTKLEDQDWVINPNNGHKVDMKKMLTEFRLATIYINSNFPFFGTLMANLKYMYSFQVPTACTDGTRLIMNPEFMMTLSIRMKAFVIMHEIMHCALDHCERGKNHDHYRSNIAADYEANGLLWADGVVTEEDLKPYIFDQKWVRKAYETIYAANPDASNAQKQQTQQGGQQGSNSQQGQQGQQGSGETGSGNNQQNDDKPKSPDFISGWNRALEDYKSGKLKL